MATLYTRMGDLDILYWKACDGLLVKQRFQTRLWRSRFRHIQAARLNEHPSQEGSHWSLLYMPGAGACTAWAIPHKSVHHSKSQLFPFPSVGAHLIVNTCRPRAGIHRGVRITQDTVVLKTDPVAQQSLVPGDCQIVDSPMGQNWDMAAMASLLRRRLRHHDFDSDPPYVNVPEVDCASAARTEGMVTNQA